MKSLNLYIQSALESLDDCAAEVKDARLDVLDLEDKELDPPVSSTALESVLAHCEKAQRELRSMAKKAR